MSSKLTPEQQAEDMLARRMAVAVLRSLRALPPHVAKPQRVDTAEAITRAVAWRKRQRAVRAHQQLAAACLTVWDAIGMDVAGWQ